MKIRILSIFILGCTIFSSCKNNDSIDKSGGVSVRVHNSSGFPIDSLYFNSNGSEGMYRVLPIGSYSEYQEYDYIYRHAEVQFQIGLDTFYIAPVDYVGEQKYESGTYTYKVSITNYANKVASLDFITE